MKQKRLSDLKGLGERSEEVLAMVGIHTVEEFLAADPFEIYKDLKATVPGTSINALYAMIGAQEDRHWQAVKNELKTTIILRLEEMGIAPK
ncbi:DNA transformation protein [Alteromonadaceae bacterium 2753L.S.0a.02]|nr:DNA transformation protein [Alteromonadaceae bacterium 2753L.S.0a.02]